MKIAWRMLGLTALAASSIPLTLLYTQQAISSYAPPEPIAVQQALPQVTVETVTSGQYTPTIQAFAEVRAVDEITLSSQIAGRVIWRHPDFIAGSRVQKDEVLIKLDDTDFRAALATAQQALAEAELALQQEQRQHRQAKQEWQRAGLSDQPSPLLLREPQLEVAKRRHQAAKAALTQARRDLQQTQLRAPFNAVVLQRHIAQGSYLEVGSAVAMLRASDHAQISIALSASQWQQLPVDPNGHPVRLSSQANPQQTWQGQVQQLAATVDTQTRLRQLLIRVEQPLDQAPPLLFGSFVSARLAGLPMDNLFAIPSTALTADNTIWWVKDGALQRHVTRALFSNGTGGKLFIPQESLPSTIQVVRQPMKGYLPDMQVQPKEDGA